MCDILNLKILFIWNPNLNTFYFYLPKCLSYLFESHDDMSKTHGELSTCHVFQFFISLCAFPQAKFPRTFPQANLSFNLNRRYNGGKSTTLLARGSKERSPGSLEKWENPKGERVRERYSNSYDQFWNSQSAPKLYMQGSNPERPFKIGQ